MKWIKEHWQEIGTVAFGIAFIAILLYLMFTITPFANMKAPTYYEGYADGKTQRFVSEDCSALSYGEGFSDAVDQYQGMYDKAYLSYYKGNGIISPTDNNASAWNRGYYDGAMFAFDLVFLENNKLCDYAKGWLAGIYLFNSRLLNGYKPIEGGLNADTNT